MELKDIKIKTFSEFLNDKTNPVVYCLLSSKGKDFLARESYSVEIHQYIGRHDEFKIITPEDSFDKFHDYILQNSRSLLGDPLTIQFYQYGKVVQSFSGIITKIHCERQTGGGYGKLHISGHTPSILLDSGKECNSFEEKTLQEIIEQVGADYGEEAKITIPNGLNTKKMLPYTVQYKETDYEFISRLANYYGEFFYYDGNKLVFGRKVQETVELGENLNLIKEAFTLEVKPQDFKYINYDSEKADTKVIDSQSQSAQFKNNPIQGVAHEASKKLFQKETTQYYSSTSLLNTEGDLIDVVTQQKDLREHLLVVKGESRDPRLKMSGMAKITDINAKPMETYRITKISHYQNGNEYYNTFEGIPDMFTSPNFDEEAFPKCEKQPAIVKDNNDPLGMGRVRVQFAWQVVKNELSPWIRIIQPYTGSEKGFYFIPEIGEEVMVDFEGGNAERPFVLGAHYNGKEKNNYHTQGNDKKVIHTRSGTKIILNDAEGSVFIEDPSGNTYSMDGNGNISVNAPKNMTFTAGENLTIKVGKDMQTIVGNNSMTNVAQRIDVSSNQYGEKVTTNKDVAIGGDLTEQTASTTHNATKGNIIIHSAKISKLLGGVDAKVNKA